MSYEPRSYDPYTMEKKLNDCVGGGGIDPSAISELQAEIDILGSQNSVMVQDIVDIKGSLNSLTAAYSTTEHKTGRKWTDGKDIYERTFTFSESIIVSSSGTSTGISALGINNIVNVIGVGVNTCITPMTYIKEGYIEVAQYNDAAISSLTLSYTKTI